MIDLSTMTMELLMVEQRRIRNEIRARLSTATRESNERKAAPARGRFTELSVNDNAGGRNPTNHMTASILYVEPIVGHPLRRGDGVTLTLDCRDGNTRVIRGVTMMNRVHFKGTWPLRRRGDSQYALSHGDPAIVDGVVKVKRHS